MKYIIRFYEKDSQSYKYCCKIHWNNDNGFKFKPERFNGTSRKDAFRTTLNECRLFKINATHYYPYIKKITIIQIF